MIYERSNKVLYRNIKEAVKNETEFSYKRLDFIKNKINRSLFAAYSRCDALIYSTDNIESLDIAQEYLKKLDRLTKIVKRKVEQINNKYNHSGFFHKK